MTQTEAQKKLRPAIQFMRSDIKRELDMASQTRALTRAGQTPVWPFGGGNVLAAIGLLCFTDFLGSFVTGRRGPRQSRANFMAFYNRLPACYQSLLVSGPDVYDTFRNGLVHEYAVKRSCVVRMSRRRCGLGRLNRRLYFSVGRYFDDLMVAAEALYDDPAARMPRLARPKKKKTRPDGH